MLREDGANSNAGVRTAWSRFEPPEINKKKAASDQVR